MVTPLLDWIPQWIFFKVSCDVAEWRRGWTYSRDVGEVIEMQTAESCITTLIPERFKLEHNVTVMEHLVVIKDDSAACHYKLRTYSLKWWRTEEAIRLCLSCPSHAHDSRTERPHVEPGKSVESGRPCLRAHTFTPRVHILIAFFKLTVSLIAPSSSTLFVALPSRRHRTTDQSHGSAGAWLWLGF